MNELLDNLSIAYPAGQHSDTLSSEQLTGLQLNTELKEGYLSLRIINQVTDHELQQMIISVGHKINELMSNMEC